MILNAGFVCESQPLKKRISPREHYISIKKSGIFVSKIKLLPNHYL